MATKLPLNKYKLHIADRQCSECLFSSNKIVSNARRKQILKDCKHTGRYFVCHKGTIAGETIVCAGFYASQSTNAIRMAERLRLTEFIDADEVGRAALEGEEE